MGVICQVVGVYVVVANVIHIVVMIVLQPVLCHVVALHLLCKNREFNCCNITFHVMGTPTGIASSTRVGVVVVWIKHKRLGRRCADLL